MKSFDELLSVGDGGNQSQFSKIKELFDLDDDVTREQVVGIVDTISIVAEDKAKEDEIKPVPFDENTEYVFLSFDEHLFDRAKTYTRAEFSEMGIVKKAKDLIINIDTCKENGYLPRIITDNLGQMWVLNKKEEK